MKIKILILLFSFFTFIIADSLFDLESNIWANNDTTVWLSGNFDTPQLSSVIFFNNSATPYTTGTKNEWNYKPIYIQLGNYVDGSDFVPTLVTSTGKQDNSTIWRPLPVSRSIANTIPTTGGVITIKGRFLSPATKASASLKFAGGDSIILNTVTSTNGGECYLTIDNTHCGINITISLKMRNQVALNPTPSSNNMMFSFEPPTISKITNIEDKITITGVGFCATSSFLKAYIDGIDTPVLADSFSQTNAYLQGNKNMNSGTHSLSLNALGNILPENKTFTILPILKMITSVNTKGGNATLTGVFFNLYKLDGSKLPANVTVDDIICANPVNVDGDPNKLICQMPPGSGTNKLVKVTIGSVSSTEKVLFSYGVPEISKYTQNGTVGTLYGYSFGDTDLTVVNFGNTTVKPTKIDAINNVEYIEFEIPNVRNSLVKITVGIQKSNTIWFTSAPLLSSISPSQTRGSVVTLTGNYLFLTDANKTALPTSITVGKVQCTNPKELAAGTTLTCQMPPGIGTADASLSINKFTTESVPFTYNSPVIQQCYQVNNYAHLIGSDFALDKYSNSTQVHFRNLSSSAIGLVNTVANFTHITFRIPDNAPLGFANISITLAGLLSTTINMTVAPTVDNITEVGVGGGLVTFNGHFLNFFERITAGSYNELPNEIRVGDYECQNITSPSSLTFTCQMPPGVGKDHLVSITINGTTTSENDPPIHFHYSAPKVSYITPVSEKGGVITINGQNLNTPMKVRLENIAKQLDCVNISVVPKSKYTQVICSLPDWGEYTDNVPEGDTEMDVTVGNQLVQATYAYDLTELHKLRRDNDRKAKMKWLIPAIVVPAVVGIAAIVVITVVLVKRHRENKALRKMFRK